MLKWTKRGLISEKEIWFQQMLDYLNLYIFDGASIPFHKFVNF